MRVLATGLKFPEGPTVLPGGDILVTELVTGNLLRVPEQGGEPQLVAECGGSTNGTAIGPDGAIYVCNSGGWQFTSFGDMYIPGTHEGTRSPDYIGGRIQKVDIESGKVEDLYTECDGRPLNAPNDLVFDETGGFWFTDHGHSHDHVRDEGALYYAKADGSSITRMVEPIHSPNGVGLSPDGSRVYVADTHAYRVLWWELSGPGKLANERPFYGNGGNFLIGPEGPAGFDSLAIDSAGNVCVATLVQGGITVAPPAGGSYEHVPLEDGGVTNLCFGGPDLTTAYVTFSLSGRLVAIDWPRPGLKLAFQQ